MISKSYIPDFPPSRRNGSGVEYGGSPGFDPVVAPPSTTRQCPLVFPDSSDARYRAAFATSIVCPGLPRIGDSSARLSLTSDIASWSSKWAFATSGVAVYPGAMELTRIPYLHSSAATFFVNPTMAVLAAA